MAIFGPYTTPPFGANVSISGNPAFAGGQTRTYSNFDTAMFSNIYWGPVTAQAAMDGAVNSAGETLTFSGISPDGLTATWVGQTIIPVFNGVGYTNTTVFTRFVAQITGTSGTATWVSNTAPDPDINGGPAVLVDMDESVNQFTVSLRFEASFTQNGTYQSFLTFYDQVQTPPGNPPGTSGPAITSVDFGLYLQDNPTVDSAPIWQNHNGAAA